MDPRKYVDARWSALIRAAVMLGAPEAEAPEIVRRVLADNDRRIKRADDPDPLVHRALAAAIPRSGQTRFALEQDLEARREMLMDAPEDVAAAPVAPATTTPSTRRRRWAVPAAIAAAAAAAAIGLAVSAQDRDDDPSTDRLREDQVPSLFGYDAAAARALLDERGFDVTVEPFRSCDVADRVIATDPVVGTTYSPGDAITVYTAVPTDVACLTNYSDIETAWQLVDFAHGRGSTPAFADRVIVYLGDGPGVVVTDPRDPDQWVGTQALVEVRRATDQVALVDTDPPTYAQPSLRVGPVRDAGGCGAPNPPVTAPDEALTFEIRAPGDRTSCPTRVDLFRQDGRRIDALVVYPALSPGA